MNYPVKYGHYNLIPDSLPCESEFTLKLRPMDLRVQWRRCSLTADYISNYCSYQEKLDSDASNTISIIINELIENAAKFSKDRKGEIFLDLKYYSEILKIEIKNLTDEISKNKLEKSISALVDRNSDEIYINKLKKEKKRFGNRPFTTFKRLPCSIRIFNQRSFFSYLRSNCKGLLRFKRSY